MAEYIEKQAAIESALAVVPRDEYYDRQIEVFINLIPPADVRPVVRGKWIIHDCGEAICPVCKTRQKNIWDYDGWQNFCGTCGADMREDKP